MDVNKELKFLRKFTKNSEGGRGGVGREARWGSGWWGGQGGCECNVGGRGRCGVWGCESRIEGNVQY